ncbi:hypothetical protein AXX17_AT3G06180 [Arabidopsis thaliana]|uniref:Uncharacterized protein n=1 Tax=Arabidopsis thaliana TaxID=3702 RepID=A0A178V6C7_ARATH|nr:hypothetical protein AXX17_AT3G06180 [Arabidopsis thaliana]
MNVASCFVCSYLSVVSLMKLCYVENDLGFRDGIASVALSIFTHYCEAYHCRVLGIFICWGMILLKNILFTACCRRCSEAATIRLPVQHRGGGGGAGGGGGDGGGGGGAGGDGGGNGRRRDGDRHRSRSRDLSGSEADSFYSARINRSQYKEEDRTHNILVNGMENKPVNKEEDRTHNILKGKGRSLEMDLKMVEKEEREEIGVAPWVVL